MTQRHKKGSGLSRNIQRTRSVMQVVTTEQKVISHLEHLEETTKYLIQEYRVKKREVQRTKLKILRNIYDIWEDHRNDLPTHYANNLILYIAEALDYQDYHAAKADAKLIEMLSFHKRPDLLSDEESKIPMYHLRRVSHIRDRFNPENGREQQRELLESIGTIDRQELDEIISKWLDTKIVHRILNNENIKPWSVRDNAKKKTISIGSFENEEYRTKVLDLMKRLTPDKIDELLESLEEN